MKNTGTNSIDLSANLITIPERQLNKNARPIQVEIDADGHWFYVGHNPKAHKPQVKRNGRFVYVHRIIYELYRGTIPDGFRLVTTCGNKFCVCPSHHEARRPMDISPVLGKVAMKKE